jgi:glucokinase
MRKSKDLILGVDIGGTKVAAGLVNAKGEILFTERTRMIARKSADEGFQAVRDAIDLVLRHRRAKEARAIGVSAPGWVDSKRGVLLSATNLPCFRDFPLVREIEKLYGLPARLGNDANVAALAEAGWGSGAGYANVFYVTLGTGIGTGMVVDKRIYHGRTGAAGEGGHMTINFQGPVCGCGKRGCIEMYSSGTAIARRARERLNEPGASASRLRTTADQNIEAITAETVSGAAKAGDKLATEILEEAADHLAIWLGNVIDLLEPDIIVVGGGLARLLMPLLGRIRSGLETWAINPHRQEVPIVEAHYGSQSALVGAAALWLPRAQFSAPNTHRANRRAKSSSGRR